MSTTQGSAPVYTGDPQTDLLRSSASDIAKVLGIGLTGGALFRGLLNLPRMLGMKQEDPRRYLGPSVVALPLPVYTKKKDKDRAQQLKAGSEKMKQWWYPPAMIGGGLLSTYFGYKMIDNLLKKQRKQESADELQNARDEYARTLVSQYSPQQVTAMAPTLLQDSRVKLSSDLRVQAALDRLADKVEQLEAKSVEKQASIWDYLPEQAQYIPGGYLGLATLLAMPAAWAAYHHTKDRSPAELTDKALKARDVARWGAKPPEVFVLPTPVHLTRQNQIDSDEEEDILPTPKVAANWKEHLASGGTSALLSAGGSAVLNAALGGDPVAGAVRGGLAGGLVGSVLPFFSGTPSEPERLPVSPYYQQLSQLGLQRLVAPYGKGDEKLYPGFRIGVNNEGQKRERAAVQFDDGDQALVDPRKTRSLDEFLGVNKPVWSNWRGSGLYFPGKLTSYDASTGNADVAYDDGDTEKTHVSYLAFKAMQDIQKRQKAPVKKVAALQLSTRDKIAKELLAPKFVLKLPS